MDLDQKVKAMETEIERLNNAFATLNFKFLEIGQQLKAILDKVPTKQPGAGVPVWESYRTAYVQRYHHEPARNAKVNRACSDIAKRIGKDAPAVAEFYVLRANDPQWSRLNHPIGILLMNCESIYSMWKQGGMKSIASARTDERRAGNIDASRAYLERKHGGRDDQG